MKKFIALLAVVFVASCSGGDHQAQEATMGLRMSNYHTAMDVSKIRVINVNRAQNPYSIGDLIHPSPEVIVREWAKSRFSAVGTNEKYGPRLEVYIREASLTRKSAIRGHYGRPSKCSPYGDELLGDSFVYRATVSVEVKVISCTGRVIGSVFSNTFEERIGTDFECTPVEGVALDDLMYGALAKADVELEIGIRRYLDKYVR